MQAQLSAIGDLIKTLGPTGAVVAYLLYRDLIQPRRNGRNGKLTNPISLNPKDFATAADVAKLGESLRELRNTSEANHSDYLQRMTRVETKVDSLERNERLP